MVLVVRFVSLARFAMLANVSKQAVCRPKRIVPEVVSTPKPTLLTAEAVEKPVLPVKYVLLEAVRRVVQVHSPTVRGCVPIPPLTLHIVERVEKPVLSAKFVLPAYARLRLVFRV